MATLNYFDPFGQQSGQQIQQLREQLQKMVEDNQKMSGELREANYRAYAAEGRLKEASDEIERLRNENYELARQRSQVDGC